MKKTILVSVMVATVVAVLFGAAPALASTGTPNSAQADTSVSRDTRIENLLNRERNVLAKQKQRLERAQQAIDKTEEWIDKLKEQGKDTAALESALDAYEAAAGDAEQYLESAESILATHAGFDSSGHVTDRTQAAKTIRDAGKAERQFHLAMARATLDFREAVHDYRRAD
jgi:TolA-binding protein